MSTRFLRIAVVYFVIAVALGLQMGIVEKFTQVPVHAHLNLLGWVSTALFGLIYHAYPAAGATTLARWHFWIHNLTLPVFMVSLYMMLDGTMAAAHIVEVSATVMVVAVALFALNVWRTIPTAN